MHRLAPNAIEALLQLLVDGHSSTASAAREHLLKCAEDKEVRWRVAEAARSSDPVLRGRARLLYLDMQLQLLTRKWQWLGSQADTDIDLEEGAILIARYEYPDVDAGAASAWLDDAALAIGQHVRPELTMYHTIGWINTYLFETLGFRGDANRYYSIENSCINRVIERRCGIPITLSLIYLLIARRLDLPVFGVAMPGHFVVQFVAEETVWIDPFHRGRLLSADDCARRVEEMGFSFQKTFLEPVSNRDILRRMLTNMQRAYYREALAVRAEHIKAFIDMLSP